MHISPSVGMDSDRIPTVLSRMGPITSSIPPATQIDILGILQREQDHAMALLSSSPLLSSLFVSYANRAAALELTSSAPSPESEGGKVLQTTIAALREEIEKLELENLGVTGKLEVAVASQEMFRSQVSSLKEANTTKQDDIKSLRAELVEIKEKYSRLMVNSNAGMAALQIQVFDLEARRDELKETVVEQQIKISKLEREGSNRLSNLPEAATPTATADTHEHPMDAAQDSPLTEPTPPALPSESASEVVPHTGLELPKESEEVKDEVPAIPQPQPTLSPHEPNVPSAAGPEESNPSWERKKPKTTPPVPAPSSSGGGGKRNALNALGDTGKNESITLTATAGVRQLGPVETATDSARSNVTTKPTPARALPPKSSGWGSWGSSLLSSIADQVLAPEMSSSPESPPFKLRVEDPPRGFTSTPTLKLDSVGEERTDKGKGKTRAVDSGDVHQPEPEPLSMEDDALADTLRETMTISRGASSRVQLPDEAGPSGSSTSTLTPDTSSPPLHPISPLPAHSDFGSEQAEIDHAILMSSLEYTGSSLHTLLANFTFPTQLDFHLPSDTDSHPSSLTDEDPDWYVAAYLPTTSANATVINFIRDVRGLLRELDSIDDKSDVEVVSMKEKIAEAINEVLQDVKGEVEEAIGRWMSVQATEVDATGR